MSNNRSPETNLLIKFFMDKSVKGEDITYADMAELFHVPPHRIKEDYYGFVQSAKRYCEMYNNQVFQTLRGVGYRPLKNSEVADFAVTEHKVKLRNLNERTKSRLQRINYDALDGQGKLDFNAGLVVLGTSELAVDDKYTQQVKQIVKQQGHSTGYSGLDNIMNVIRAFKDAG